MRPHFGRRGNLYFSRKQTLARNCSDEPSHRFDSWSESPRLRESRHRIKAASRGPGTFARFRTILALFFLMQRVPSGVTGTIELHRTAEAPPELQPFQRTSTLGRARPSRGGSGCELSRPQNHLKGGILRQTGHLSDTSIGFPEDDSWGAREANFGHEGGIVFKLLCHCGPYRFQW